MAYMLYSSVGTGVNRFDQKDEDVIDLRQSVSVQMKIRVNGSSHSSDASFGITLFDVTERPDVLGNTGKNIRILSPTISGSELKFKVMLDAAVVAETACVAMDDTVENLVEYRFWQDVDGFKVQYYLNTVLQASLNVSKSVFSDSLRFRVGTTLTGTAELQIYTLDIAAKEKVSRTIYLQGQGQYNVPAGQTQIALTGRGDKGINNPFKIDKVLTGQIDKLINDETLAVLNELPDTIQEFNGLFFFYRKNITNSIRLTTDFETYTNGDPTIQISNSFVWKDKLYLRTTDDVFKVTSDGVNFENVNVPTFSTNTMSFVGSERRLFLFRSNGGGAQIHTTSDGLIWDMLSFSGGDIIDTGNQYFWLKYAECKTSNDGVTWFDVTNLPTTTGFSPVYGNGVLALMSDHVSGRYNTIVYTLDFCQTWTSVTINGITNYIDRLLYCNNTFVAVPAKSAVEKIYYTADFVTIQELANAVVNTGDIVYPRTIRVIKSKFVCNSPYLTSSVLISEDLAHWETTSIIGPNDSFFETRSALVKKGNVYYKDTGWTVKLDDSLVETKDGITGAQCLVSVNGQNNPSFPISTTSVTPNKRTILTNPNTSSAFVVDYNTPIGTSLEMTFLDSPTNHLRGELIAQNCQGVNLVNRYTDGNGGEYLEIVTSNSAACGYVADTEKVATLSGAGSLVIPAGTDEITVSGRGSSLVDTVYAVATQVRNISFDIMLIPEGWRYADIAFGNGVYVLIAYKTNLVVTGDVYTLAAFYSTDLKNWTKADYSLTASNNRVSFVVNRFYIHGSNYESSLVSTTGMNDWVTTTQQFTNDPSNEFAKFKNMLGLAVTHVEGPTIGYYAWTTDGVTINRTPSTIYSHWAIGMFTDGEVIVSYGRGSSQYNFIRTTTDMLNWTQTYLPIPDPSNSIIRFMRYLNGVYYGLINTNTTSVAIKGEIRGTSLDSLVYTAFPEVREKIQLTTLGNNFVRFDLNVVEYSADGVTWTTEPMPSELFMSFDDMISATKIYDTQFIALRSNSIALLKTIPVGDQYASEFLKLGKDAKVSVGSKFKLYPGNIRNTAPAAVTSEVYAVDPGAATYIVYDCPEGSSVNITYMAVADNNPINGTLLSQSCNGVNMMGQYANGVGGTYSQLIESNSTTCGYTVPVVRANINYRATVDIVETETKEIAYTLNQPLEVDVSFVFSMNFIGTAEASDLENIRFAVGAAALAPLAVSDVITVPAGVTMFKVAFTATEDFINENVEAIDFVMTPSLNSIRIINTILNTLVNLTSNNMLVSPDSFDTNSVDEINSNVYYYKVGAGFTNSERIVRTNNPVTAGRFAIEIIDAAYENLRIGFGTVDAVIDNGGSFVYPGQDTHSWGFSSAGNYHNGSVVNTGPSWTGANTKLILLLDMVAGTAEMLVNGMSVGNVFTGLPTNLYLMIGVTAPGKSAMFYLNMGQNVFSPEAIAAIPSSYYHGFGYLTQESSWTPEQSPAVTDSGITPSGMTGPTQGSVIANGIVKIHSTFRSQTVVPINDGNGVFEVKMLSRAVIRIGVHSNTFTGVAGTTADSWAVMSDGSAIIHNNVTTDFLTPEPRNIITLVIDLIGRTLAVKFGSNATTIATNLPINANLVVSLATDVTLANGGTYVFANCGQSSFNNQAYNVVQGIGTPIGIPFSGTALSSYCTGFDLTVVKADGSGSTYDELYAKNSTVCGYIPPLDSVSGFSYSTKSSNAHYNADGTNVEFTNYGMVLGYKPVNSGKIYWEVKSNNVYVGVANDTVDTSQYLTYDNNSFFVSLVDGWTYSSNQDEALSNYYAAEIQDKWVGFMLDMDTNTFSVKFESGTIVELTDFDSTPLVTPLRLAISADSQYDNVLVNMGQSAFNNGIPGGYVTWFAATEAVIVPPPGPSLYYDDYTLAVADNTPNQTWEDYYKVHTPGSPLDPILEVVASNGSETGYLSIKKPEIENNANFWIWVDAPFVSQVRATYELEVPNQQVNDAVLGYIYMPLGTPLAGDDSQAFIESSMVFSIYGETDTVRNAPLEVFIRRDGLTTVESATRDGLGYLYAGPSTRGSSGTVEAVTIASTVALKFVVEVINDETEGCKRSNLYLNNQLLRTTLHATLSNDKLIMVAASPMRLSYPSADVDGSIVKLKKVLIEEIELP